MVKLDAGKVLRPGLRGEGASQKSLGDHLQSQRFEVDVEADDRYLVLN